MINNQVIKQPNKKDNIQKHKWKTGSMLGLEGEQDNLYKICMEKIIQQQESIGELLLNTTNMVYNLEILNKQGFVQQWEDKTIIILDISSYVNNHKVLLLDRDIGICKQYGSQRKQIEEIKKYCQEVLNGIKDRKQTLQKTCDEDGDQKNQEGSIDEYQNKTKFGKVMQYLEEQAQTQLNFIEKSISQQYQYVFPQPQNKILKQLVQFRIPKIIDKCSFQHDELSLSFEGKSESGPNKYQDQVNEKKAEKLEKVNHIDKKSIDSQKIDIFGSQTPNKYDQFKKFRQMPKEILPFTHDNKAVSITFTNDQPSKQNGKDIRETATWKELKNSSTVKESTPRRPLHSRKTIYIRKA